MTIKSLIDVRIKDADLGLVTAVISTFGVIDRDGDVTSKSTFTQGAPVIVSGYGHSSWEGALPIGKGTIRTTDTEALADLEFFLEEPHAKAAFGVIKRLGAQQEWSYSLLDTKAHRGQLDGMPANFLESTLVSEVSPVIKGASINTRTLAVKAEGSTKFSEHIDAVGTAVEELIARAADVVTKRTEIGKSLGEESREQLKRLDAQLVKLRTLLDEPAPTIPPPDDAAQHEWLRSVRASLEGASR